MHSESHLVSIIASIRLIVGNKTGDLKKDCFWGFAVQRYLEWCQILGLDLNWTETEKAIT